MSLDQKLQEQIAWEQEASRRGTERYYANQQRLRENGQGDSTDVMSFLIKDRLEDAAEYIEDLVGSGKGGISGHYDSLIRTVADGDYLKIAYLGLKSVLKAIQIKEKNTVAKVAVDIAARIEADLKCQMFEALHPEYYDTVRKSFSQQNVTDYVHKHKVMMKKFSDFDLEWTDWTPNEKVQVGVRVLKGILAVFGDVVFKYKEYNKSRQLYKLGTTPEFDEWAKEFEKERGLLFPMYLPMKIPPVPWENLTEGGYYTREMRVRLHMVKTKSKEHKKFVRENFPEAHKDAINKLQRTPWKINKRVLEVQKEIYQNGLGIGMPNNERIVPPDFPEHLKDIEKEDLTPEQKEEVREWKVHAKACYGKEQKRKGQVLAFIQSHKLANELKDWDKFYFVYTADFRGRLYCATAGLSPQGADQAKGLLQFARGVTLGKSGVYWLAVQGANTYGEDKLPYDDRVQWIKDREEVIRAIVDDPIGNRNLWGEADKPYQFLAFCFEWEKCDFGRNTTAKSSIPVGLDGSCNGLQHFSALLRDNVGAKATNLKETLQPEDIYTEVADKTVELLKEEPGELAEEWLRVGVSRKCAKRPVMTLPYGATKTSARQYIMDYVVENWGLFSLQQERQWDLANFLTPILWQAIGEVVIAARAGMDWMQGQTKGCKDFMKWLTPIKFPVYQYYKDVKSTTVKTQLDGMVRLNYKDLDGEGVASKREQRNGIAPNFIHSIDSTHMVMTINGTKLESYAMIHDDFGTHAGNVAYLQKAIRVAFLKLYAMHDPLVSWANQVGADTTGMPQRGDYDIREILKADYFFG